MNKTKLVEQIIAKQSYLCVGLDTDIEKLPAHLPKSKEGVIAFNKAIIDATAPYCVSYKINTAFYESQGVKGWEAMEATLAHIPSTHFTIADAKRGDIGNTSAQYAKTFFEVLPFDAITVAPYMGKDSISGFYLATGLKPVVINLDFHSDARLSLDGPHSGTWLSDAYQRGEV
jgi:orotidine-5'-phosphate decarboxylase